MHEHLNNYTANWPVLLDQAAEVGNSGLQSCNPPPTPDCLKGLVKMDKSW